MFLHHTHFISIFLPAYYLSRNSKLSPRLKGQCYNFLKRDRFELGKGFLQEHLGYAINSDMFLLNQRGCFLRQQFPTSLSIGCSSIPQASLSAVG